MRPDRVTSTDSSTGSVDYCSVRDTDSEVFESAASAEETKKITRSVNSSVGAVFSAIFQGWQDVTEPTATGYHDRADSVMIDEERRALNTAMVAMAMKLRSVGDFTYEPGFDNEVRSLVIELARNDPETFVSILPDLLSHHTTQLDESILLEVIDTIPEAVPEGLTESVARILLSKLRSKSPAIVDSALSVLWENDFRFSYIRPAAQLLEYSSTNPFIRAQAKKLVESYGDLADGASEKAE